MQTQITSVLTLLILSLGSPALYPAEAPEIREWPVPWENTRPRDPYVGPEGDVWFVGQAGDYVGVLDPDEDAFRRFELDPATGPHNLIVAPSGTVWYAGNRAAHIGRLDPATGEIKKIPTPERAAPDPHTLVFDEAGDIWFTVQRGNRIGHLDVASRELELIDVPTPGARPYGIKIDSEGTVWATLFGTYKLARVDPGTLRLAEFALPRPKAHPRRLAITDDDRIWYVDYARGMLGRYDPRRETFREWLTPSGPGSLPYGMARDARNRIWFVETGVSPNRLVGFDTEQLEFLSSTPIPSGGGTVRHMFHHAPTGTIWFGADTNTVGRVRLPD